MAQTPSAVPARNPVIPINQSIYEDTTTQKAPLGTRLELGDRTFYYAYAAASQARGKVLCAANPVASHNGALCTFAATSAGSKVVTITAGSAITVNQYAEGYLGISKGTMGGATYKIKKNDAIDSGSTGTITLYDALYDDVAAADEVGLVKNLYDSVIVGSSAMAIPVCVPMVDVAATSYFWGQTYGPAAPLAGGANAVAAPLICGTLGAAIAAATDVGAGQTIVGFNYNLAGTSAEYTPSYLTLRP